MPKLEASCDELCELNGKLSLPTQGTEKQNAFEKQMNLVFQMMDLSMDTYLLRWTNSDFL